MARRRSVLLVAGVATAALAGCSTAGGTTALSTSGTSNGVWETLPPTSTTVTTGTTPSGQVAATPGATTKPATVQAKATTTTSTTFRFVTPTYTTRTTTVAPTSTTAPEPTTTAVLQPCPVASDLTAAVDRWTTYYQDGGTMKQGRPYGKWTVTLSGHVSNASAVQVSVDSFGVDATPPEELMRTVRLMVANVGPGASRSWVTQYTYPSYATAPDGSAYANGDWTHTIGILDWSPMVTCR